MESEELLVALRTLWRRLGHPPLIREWQAWADRPVHWHVFRRRFGSWSQALLLAWEPALGSYAGRRRESSILDALLAQDPAGLDPVQRRIRARRREGCSVKAIAAALGCSEVSVLRYARRGATFRYSRQPSWTSEMIRQALQGAYEQHGDVVLTVEGWRSRGLTPSPTTILRRFGTWIDAWEAAVPGVHPQSFGGIVRRLRDAETQYGPAVRRQATWRRLGLHPTPDTIAHYTGSWEAAWAAVGPALGLEDAS